MISILQRFVSHLLGSSTREAATLPARPNGDSPVNVVIVGGGVIGLCTAYQLAKLANSQFDSRINIVVLEARVSTFQSASSHNTGCLHYGYEEPFGSDLLPLGKYSFDIWKSIAEDDEDFKKETGYRAQSFFWVACGDNDGIEKVLPNWVKIGNHWKMVEKGHGDNCATINPEKLGAWLENACTSLGVTIQTSTTATEAIISEEGTIEAIRCVLADRAGERLLPCNSLVLAAGPWTPQQIQTMFPHSTLDLAPTTLAGDWLLLKNAIHPDEKSTASVFFNHIVGEKLEFSGRNDRTIWVCGKTNSTASLPPLGEETPPDDLQVADLLEYSRQFIRDFDDTGDENDTLTVVDKGRSFRPMRQSGLPLITEIPSQFISLIKPPKQRSGVFVSYGHGSYGTSLGIGSGKLMAQLILGEDLDIDLSKFTIR